MPETPTAIQLLIEKNTILKIRANDATLPDPLTSIDREGRTDSLSVAVTDEVKPEVKYRLTTSTNGNDKVSSITDITITQSSKAPLLSEGNQQQVEVTHTELMHGEAIATTLFTFIPKLIEAQHQVYVEGNEVRVEHNGDDYSLGLQSKVTLEGEQLSNKELVDGRPEELGENQRDMLINMLSSICGELTDQVQLAIAQQESKTN